VLYAYPRTGHPDEPGPPDWDAIPGARGCTPQACSYRDHHAELRALGAQVFGLSTQTTAYQQEMAQRLQLPYEVLGDAEFRLTEALTLPTFEAGGMRLLKRFTLLVHAGRIEACFYPVFPPDADSASNIALAFFSFPSLAAYEVFRTQMLTDPECQAAFKYAEETRCFLSYERTFFRPMFE
jgi:peroxiredoxin